MDFLFKVRDELGFTKLVEYNPNPFEIEWVKDIKETHRTITRHDRQIGFTTLMTLMITNELIQNPEAVIIYLGHSTNINAGVVAAIEDILDINMSNYEYRSKECKEMVMENGAKLITTTDGDKLRGIDSTWIIIDGVQQTPLFSAALHLGNCNNSKITIGGTPSNNQFTPFKEHYFKTLVKHTEYQIFDYRFYDCQRYNKEMSYFRGNIELPYNYDNPKENERLEQYGFKLSSALYSRYLNIFGFDDEMLVDEFDKFMNDYLDVINAQ